MQITSIVLDASVLLALVKGEPINWQIVDVLDGALMSAVNLCEVLSKLEEIGIDPSSRVVASTLSLLRAIEPFTEQQAIAAARLRPLTRAAGLSLGDRACFALALERNAEIYTSDRAWTSVGLGCTVHLVR